MLITSLALGFDGTLWLSDSDPTNPCVRTFTGLGRFSRSLPAIRQIVPTRSPSLYGVDAQGGVQYLSTMKQPQPLGPPVNTVAVGRDKRPWATLAGSLLRLKPDNTWETMPAPARPIAVRPIDANNVWLHAGGDYNVSKAYRWNGSTWTDAGSPGPIHELQVGMDGSVFALDFDYSAMRRYRSDGNWDVLPPAPGPYIAVVSAAEIWSGDVGGDIWQTTAAGSWVQKRSGGPTERTAPPVAAVDGTIISGSSCYNGLGSFVSLGLPGANQGACAAYDLSTMWFSNGTNFSLFSGGWTWSKTSSMTLTSMGFQPGVQPNEFRYDMMWGCDASSNVYRWLVNTDPDFTPAPGLKAKKIIGNQWSLDPNGNLQASFQLWDGAQLGQPFLDIACSHSGNTLWAIGMDHQLYFWRFQRPFNIPWRHIPSPPLQAVAGDDENVWGATVPAPGTKRNAIWSGSTPA